MYRMRGTEIYLAIATESSQRVLLQGAGQVSFNALMVVFESVVVGWDKWCRWCGERYSCDSNTTAQEFDYVLIIVHVREEMSQPHGEDN